MTDLPPESKAGDKTEPGPDREAATGAPRWMKAIGIGLIVVVLLVLVLVVTNGGAGGHGPGMHN